MKQLFLILIIFIFPFFFSPFMVNATISDQDDESTRDEYVARNIETGILEEAHSFANDKNRFSLLAATALMPGSFGQTVGGEVQAGHNFTHFWGEAFFAMTKTNFRQISENPQYYTSNQYAETNNERPDNATQNLTSYGLGVSYRHHFPEELNLFNLQHLFHSTAFYGTYNLLNDTYSKTNYKGPGIKAQYGIGKRFGTVLQMGAQFSYHLAQVKRAERYAGESQNDQRLLLSWLTAAFDISFYF